MSSEVIIRGAVEADVPEIARIYNHAILNTTSTFDVEPKSIDDRLAWFRDRSGAHPVIVATVDGEVAGWAEIKPFGTRQAYQHTVENAVYVDPAYQGKGIGSSLLDKLLRLATERGFHVVLALIVAGNECSVRLHTKFGFEHVGTMGEVGRKFDKWLDLLVFEKKLNS